MSMAYLAGSRIDKITGALFYLGLSIEIAAVIIDKSSITNPVQSRMFLAAFALFFLRALACLRKIGRREGFLALALLVIAVICWRTSGRNELIRFLVFACALQTMEVRKAAKFTFFATLAGCLLLVGLSLFGILGELYLTADYGSGVETRWVLGLGHPNSLHCMALMLLLLGLWLYERQMKLYLYCLLFVGNFLLYSLTKSNTSFLVGTGALLLSLLLHYSRRLSNGSWIYIAGELLVGLGLVFTVFAATHDPRLDWRLLNFDTAYLSRRITSLWETIYHEGTLSTWKWFGSKWNTYYFDLGWARLVYWYGIVAALVVVVFLFALLRRTRKTADRASYVLLVSMALYTVLEAHLVSEFIGRNYALFVAAALLPGMLRGNGTPEEQTLAVRRKGFHLAGARRKQ